jgi:hypothetical protein
MIQIDQALRAQRALRDAAGLEEEAFPVPAFVGMISDEIETYVGWVAMTRTS